MSVASHDVLGEGLDSAQSTPRVEFTTQTSRMSMQPARTQGTWLVWDVREHKILCDGSICQPSVMSGSGSRSSGVLNPNKQDVCATCPHTQ